MASSRAALTAAVCLAATAAAPADAIVNGSPASEAYPWMAAMMVDGEQLCGATLVRPDWVLTAAHCPDGESLSELTVVLGRHKLSAGGGEEIPVDRVIVHEDFRDADIGAGHDVALMHLARPSAQQPIRLVALAETALWAPARPARVIGWGNPHFGVEMRSDDLLEADMPMRGDDECERAYRSDFDPATMVCAGEDAEYQGVCQGDSGGPLLVKDPAGEWVQVGNASYTTGCGYPTFYGVFSRIGAPTLHEWIQERLPAPAAAAPAAVSPPAPAPVPAAPASLSADRRLGSARRARRTRVVAVHVRSTARVTGLTAGLARGGRTVGSGRLTVLDGSGTVRLRVRRSLRAGRFRLRLLATDAHGRAVRLVVTVRLSR